MKNFILPAIVATATLCGVYSHLNKQNNTSLNALGLSNVEALSVVDPEYCKWIRVQDGYGCWYHHCVPGGNGFVCIGGTVAPE